MVTKDLQDELVEALHGLGVVEVTDASTSLKGSVEDEALLEHVSGLVPDTRQTRLDLARVDFMIELLERHGETKKGLLGSFLRERAHLTYEEFVKINQAVDIEGMYRELEGLDIELRQLDARRDELQKEIQALLPWEVLDVSLSDLDRLESVEFRAAALRRESLAAWADEVGTECVFTSWEDLGEQGGKVRIAALVHRDDLERFEGLCLKHGLEAFDPRGPEETLARRLERYRDEVAYNGVRQERLTTRIKDHLHRKHDLYALRDYLANQLQKKEVTSGFLATERSVLLEGWMEKERTEELRQYLGWMEEVAYIDFLPPGEDEEPPILLRNRRRVKPAENLIELFGLPNSSESDPTPFVAPFFILFFGMCIGDVGYGLLLALAFWLAQKRLDVTEKTRGFLRLFMYCGFAAMLVGVFTRGYFGIESDSLPGFLRFKGSLDVLMNPIPIMIVCIALGLLHISLGVAIEMFDNIRNNSLVAGLCEQGTTLLLWMGLAVLALGAGVKVGALKTLGAYIMAAGALGVVFFSNIGSSSLAGKFFGGLYNMYGLFASTIGDVASYLRLYALGLATVAIGSVINLMAGMVFKVPLLGVLLLALVLLGGHLFNLAINFLGAFVHPLRLQYVEFFSKFYENGGRPFMPFGLRMERTVIERPD
jgi:V/A-type H+-transporting ATPase subunit I